MAYASFIKVAESVARVPPVFDRGFFRNKLVKPAEPARYSATVVAAGEVGIVMKQWLHYDLDSLDLASEALWRAKKTTRLAVDASALKKDWDDLRQANVCHINNAYRLILDSEERDGAVLMVLAELPEKQEAWLRNLAESDVPVQLKFGLEAR